MRRRIRDDVESGAQRQQREWFLRRQMDSIRKELGEDEGSVVEEYRAKIDEAGMPDEVRAQAERELRRLETMGEASGEASMIARSSCASARTSRVDRSAWRPSSRSHGTHGRVVRSNESVTVIAPGHRCKGLARDRA